MTTPPIEMLGIYLEPTPETSTRVGTLIKDASIVQFVVDESYIERGPDRPILSAAFWAPDDEAQALRRLKSDALKTSRAQHLPPYFANLLPEGDLRALVQRTLPADAQDEFSLLARLGADLPGAVVARRELEARGVDSAPAPVVADSEQPRIKFSLAGVQLKFSMLREDHALVMPASGTGGKVIAKLEPERWPHLCEAEFLAMRLAEAAGVEVARAELVPVGDVAGIRSELFHGAYVLAVDRFDRVDSARAHTEEFAPILGKIGDAKYSENVETVVKLIARFASDGQASVLEAVRRVAVDVLLGNGDAHLKNWAFLYPGGRSPTLSPAYDIVPTVLFIDDDELALKFGGSHAFARVTRKKFARLAQIAELPEALVLDELDQVLERCLDAWPQIVRDVPLPSAYRARLARHWTTLPIAERLPNPFRADRDSFVLLEDGVSIADLDDVRPARPNKSTSAEWALTVEGTVAIDKARTYALRDSEGERSDLEIRSVRTTRNGRTRVVGRASRR